MRKTVPNNIYSGLQGELPKKRITSIDEIRAQKEEIEQLEAFGQFTLFIDAPKDDDEILRRIGENDIAITSGTPISGDVIRQAPNLELICTWSMGYNHIDLEAATEKGIVVCNAVGATTIAVAEHAMALVLALSKHLVKADHYVRTGGYDWFAFFSLELAGKTFGIIGTGNIGGYVAKLASAFGCRIIAFTKHPSPERAARLGVLYVPLDELLRQSDIICLCVSLNKGTEGLIGRAEFEQMSRKPLLVNISRGKTIDQKALLHAVRDGQVSGAGLDVLAQEPPSMNDELLREENVIFAPHMGGSTSETMTRLTKATIENIAAYLRGKPQNVVNPTGV